MRVNIYIRKENEAAWEESGKSDWINSLLRPQFKGIVKGGLLKPKKEESSNDEIAIKAFNGEDVYMHGAAAPEQPATITTLTCKDGHPSKDGKYCSNIKCSYFN